MDSLKHASAAAPAASESGAPPASTVIDLTQADLASISAARRGVPLPPDVAHKTATIIAAALQGQRIRVVHERITDPAVELEKRFATAQAKLALAGFQLERMADGSFVVARWTMTRSLADMAALEAFQQQVGAV